MSVLQDSILQIKFYIKCILACEKAYLGNIKKTHGLFAVYVHVYLFFI